MQLTRIRLTNYKNFPSVDVPLMARAFIVGPNASGKSNLLDAVRFLRDISVDEGGLQRAVQDRNGFSAIRSLHARKQADVGIEIHVGDAEEGQTVWQYRLVIRSGKGGAALVREERAIHATRGEVFSGPAQEDLKDTEALLRTGLEQPRLNRQFREIKKVFEGIEYLHLVPQIVRSRTVVNGDFLPFGSNFLEDVLATHANTRRSRLEKIRKAMQPAVPNLEALEVRRDSRSGAPHLLGRFGHWRPKAGWQDESQFSDGTLRLVALLWSAMDGEGPLLLEEPELSLHTYLVRRLPSVLWQLTGTRGRQVLMSTHSTELLSDEGIAPGELVLIRPSAEGSVVTSGAEDRDVRGTMEAGLLASEVAPSASARGTQLGLFGFGKP